MSKERIRSSQFANVNLLDESGLELNQEQRATVNELYQGIEKLRPGQLVKGTVLRVDNDGVLLDIGYKSDGLISAHEFGHDLRKIKVGEELEVILDELESPEGAVVLSYEKARELRAWESITKLFEDGKPVEGLITHKVKGGLSVDIGIPAFLPGSQVDIQRVNDFDQFVGQTVTADIIKINRKRGNVILSRRKYLHNLRTESRKKVLDSLAAESVVQGVVKNITNYGVFVDIGGIDGLLHITDMTWGRIAHPSEIVKVGDTITVKVLSIDKDNAKVSLGMKQLTDNPWSAVDGALQVGSRVKGTISSITEYGLFVELLKGVEGLVHISEVSWTERISDLRKHYKVGEEIEVLVVSVDKENRRMSLSVKQLEQNPWEALTNELQVGQHIKGVISNIADFGMFVTIKPGIDGLVHVSDLSWTDHINHPSDLYKKGQEIEVVVLGIDQNSKKVSLGIKQLTPDPWETIEQEYPRGTMVDGTVTKITSFGAFVKLPSGIEGLIHNSEVIVPAGGKVEDVLQIGQKYQFRVINVNREERKIALSMRPADAAGSEVRENRERRPSRERRPQYQAETQGPKPKSQFQLELERAMASRGEASPEAGKEGEE